ncbi:MAG: VPLPA-CTERM sorting domain-containing protein [Candidatus Thiodiazotropha endolucinida]
MDKNLLSLSIAFFTACLYTGSTQAALFDRGGGLIYDNVLDVTWLQDASYAETLGLGVQGSGKMNWVDADNWVSNLQFYDNVRDVTWIDWRMPATFIDEFDSIGFDETGQSSEMAYMYYVNLGFEANPSLDVNDPIPMSGNYNPFDNLQYRSYWSDTLTDLTASARAWNLHFHFGYQNFTGILSDELNIWAVRDGDVSPVPLPPAILLMLSGLVILSILRRDKKTNTDITA